MADVYGDEKRQTTALTTTISDAATSNSDTSKAGILLYVAPDTAQSKMMTMGVG